jgi:hypothetical protein
LEFRKYYRDLDNIKDIVEEIIKVADERMYEKKRIKKNINHNNQITEKI